LRHRHLLENNPALRREDWLPDAGESPWPEMDELRETHIRLLQERAETAQSVFDLRRNYEQEDEAAQQARVAGYLNDESAELPAVTPDDEREEALSDAIAEAEAASDAFAELCARALVMLAEKQGEWFGDLDAHRAGAIAEKEEALKAAAGADARAREFDRLRAWLARAGGGNSGLHVAWGHIDTPSADQPTELSSTTAGTELAYAGVNDGEA
jgi:hypothetical protein